MNLSLTDHAREWLNKLIDQDAQYKDLASKIGYNRHDNAQMSGAMDIDYAVSRVNVGGELEFEKTTSIPPELLERLAGVKQCCRMGIFAQCRKAWLTIDSDLYLWNYDDGEDLAFYDGCQDIIISVCLLRPKPGVLPSAIEYLLALATPTNLVILGVNYDYSTSPDGYFCNGLINVLPIPLYLISTNNYYITCLEGTSNGRLFMGNREGNLLEFTYKAVSTLDESLSAHDPGSLECCGITNHTASSLDFFLPTILTNGFRSAGAITRIAVDSRRKLLWTLSENSHLAVYQYDVPGTKTAPNFLSKLSSLSQSDLAYRASSVLQTRDRSHFQNIISICAMTDDSGPIQMMAVTSTGVRIYFADSLRIAHVRFPPQFMKNPGISMLSTSQHTSIQPFIQSQQQQQQLQTQSQQSRFALGEVRLVAETRGTVIFASLPPSFKLQTPTADHQPDTLTISVASPDAFPWSPSLCETISTSLNVESPWALTVLPPVDHEGDSINPVSSTSFNKKGIELPHDSSVPAAFPPLEPQQPAYMGPQNQISGTQAPTPGTPTSAATPQQPLPKGSPPVVFTQHLDPPYRKVLIITAHGIVHLRLPTPLQRLRDYFIRSVVSSGENMTATASATAAFGGLFVEDVGDGGGFLSTFLHQFGPQESICAAIAIAASEQGKSEIVAQAERAIIFFSTEAARFWNPPVLLTGNPSSATGGIMQGTGFGTSFSEFGFSGLIGNAQGQHHQHQKQHDALMADVFLVIGATLFLSRVARSLWRTPMLAIADRSITSGRHVSEGASSKGLTDLFYSLISSIAKAAMSSGSSDGNDSLILTSRLSSEDLEWVLHQLRYLKALLESSVQKMSTTNSGQRRIGTAESSPSPLSRLTQDLCSLLSAFIEFIGLWQVISQHNVPAITSRLTTEQRMDLINLPVEAFVCWMPRTAAVSTPSTVQTTPDIRSALISALLDYYISGQCQSASVDTLCARLRTICPSLFGNEDALCARAEELLMRAVTITISEQRGALINEAVDLLYSAGPSINIALATNKLITTVGAWGLAVSLCLTVARQRDPLDIALQCLKEGRTPETATDVSVRRLGKGTSTVKSEAEMVEGRYEAYRSALGCLGGLLELARLPTSVSRIPEPENEIKYDPAGALQCIGLNPTVDVVRRILLDILKLIFKTDDILAHFEVIGWLLNHDLLEQAVELNSPHLEAYLESRLRQSPNNVPLRRLLWRQLESRGARLEAARVLEHLATTNSSEEGLTLEDRLDYLARAIVTVKALPQSQMAETADYLADLQDRLDVAELQRQLCLELAATCTSSAANMSTTFSQASVEVALNELTRGPLISASELFSTYAEPFELHESKLLLMHFAGETDADLIEAIWLALLHRLLLNTTGGGNSSHMSSPVPPQRRRLSSRKTARGLELTIANCLGCLYSRLAASVVPQNLLLIASSAKLHVPTTVDYTFFPLVVIISTLERYAVQQNLPTNLVSTIFGDAKIPPSPEIVEAYNIIICKKDPFWMRENVRSRLMEVIYIFVAEFIESAARLSPRQRQLQSSRMLDHLTTHLVELHAEPKSGGDNILIGGGNSGASGVQSQHQQHLLLMEKLRGLRRHLDRMSSSGAAI
nr:nuclear pore complex protein nup155 [Hymenolepis microstoma]